MKGIWIKNSIVIPEHELEITASRAGGAGGQHVNKTATRITVRWNVTNTTALSDEQKKRVLQNLHNQLTGEGDLIIHSSALRSQYQNKQVAFELLRKLIRKGLYVPKKRLKTKVPKSVKEARLSTKKQRSLVKKMRKKVYED